MDARVQVGEPQLRVITDLASFEQLRPQWTSLYQQAACPNLFHSHPWLCAAWTWLQLESEPLVLTWWRGEQLFAAVALNRIRERWYGLNVVVLESLQIPDTQEYDFLCLPQESANLAGLLAHWLQEPGQSWQCLRLGRLREDAQVYGLRPDLPAALKGHSRIYCEADNTAVNLDGNWDSYYAARSRRLRKGNSNISNRLHRQYDSVVVEHITATDMTVVETGELVRRLTAISGSSWKTRTGMSLENPGPQAFIRRLTREAVEQGWLSVWILKLDGQDVAMEYQLGDGQDVFALRSDFDAAMADDSPGTYLGRVMLERLFARYAGHYFMGPGDNPYKLRWANSRRGLSTLTVYSRSPAGRLRGLLEARLRPLARALIEHFVKR